ncbi:glycosyltransferase family 2 protein [Mycetocola tolaasinivorans]|uniref:Glycosyltransferase family 2 protein n=1 Tax=Mycetocola tolaasinivorans TaxID=76635 RepID=A0A3L7A6P8_9MICO|nr:glycosyltransferase [Mycetocola tolaasinivorans]RLP76006.1 glycosyltransferase family 2 protein [Mycetocola tolaasinivorans]
MSPRVTAIVVVQDGSRDAAHLRATLHALDAQIRRPDHIVAVALASPPQVIEMLQGAAIHQIVQLRDNVSFGEAVRAGIRARVEDPAADSDAGSSAFWLLAQDTAPEPGALAALVGALEVSPSVGIVGPKLLDWDHGETIISYGESMTPLGAAVSLVSGELDQGQHDSVSDVLGVAAPGMLVRSRVWEEAGGIDPALHQADDGLDLSVRVRLAEHRVSLEPNARVRFAGDGVAGPARSRRGAVVRRQAFVSRAAQLHRRLTYANPAVVWLHWLSLLPLAIVRAVWRLITKQPELITAEIGAALRVAFGFGRVSRARATLRQSKRAGWSQLQPLRISVGEVTRRNRLRREAGTVSVVVERSDLRFISGGGGWLVAASAVLSAVLFFRFVDVAALGGGGLLPLSNTVAELWGNTGFAWRDQGLGVITAADPFATVLAVLGTLTFWNPSFSIVLLYLIALPLATLGAWFAATRLTERSGYRLFVAALWTLAPSLLGSLAAGELGAILVHLLLPWLFYTSSVFRRSWAATAVAAMLAAAILASSPSLTPAFAIIWVVLLVSAGRYIPRVIWMIVPALTLFAPLIWQQGIRAGNWWALLADPGSVVAAFPVTEGWRIALGLPAYEASGWPGLISSLGIGGVAAEWALPVLLAPFLLLALAALLFRGTLRAAGLLGIALLGLLTAVLAGHVLVTLSGPNTVAIWPAPALSLYWLGLIGAAAVGLDAMRRRGLVPALVVGVLAVVVAGPMISVFPAGNSPVHATDGRTLPAYVTAAAGQDPRQGTLLIRPEGADSISATLIRGGGTSLDSRSTRANTRTTLTEDDNRVADLAGNLISASGLDVAKTLTDLRVRFVLLAPASPGLNPGDAAGAEQTLNRAIAALETEGALGRVGPTDQGILWRFDGEIPPAAPAPTTWATPVVGLLTGIVFVVALLLAVPTAASRRLAEATPRTIGHAVPRSGGGRRAAGKRGASAGEGSARARRRAEREAEREAEAAVAAAVEAEPTVLADPDIPVPHATEDDTPAWPEPAAPPTAAAPVIEPAPSAEPVLPAETAPTATDEPKESK